MNILKTTSAILNINIWVIEHLNNALGTWNNKLHEVYQLLTESPENFKGGEIWGVITTIHGVIQSVGFALLVLFFFVGLLKTCGSLAELKRPEVAVKAFIRLAIAKAVVTYGLSWLTAFFRIGQGLISTIMSGTGTAAGVASELPEEITEAILDLGFLESIPLWAVTLIGALFIFVLSIIILMTVYGRFFKLYMYTALSPIPLSTFAAESTQSVGVSFLKSYCGVCLEGAVIALSCVIFTKFANAPPVVDTSASVITQVWSYVFELAVNMLVLVGSVKMADKICHEMLGL